MTTSNSDQSWEWNGLDHSRAAILLAKHLSSVNHTSLEPLGYGDFSLAFKLGNQVVRVARHLEAAVALQRESCILAQIAAILPLPVPRPTYHSPLECPPFTIHGEVIGQILTRDGWENMPTAAHEKVAADLATFLKALHSIPIEIGLNCGLAQLDAAEVARSLRQAAANTIHGFLNHDAQRRLDETLARESLPSSHDWHPVMLHCDIAPGHLLIDLQTGNLTGVIDFGDIAVGEPARDFIYIYEDYGPMILREVLHRYAGEDTPLMLSEIRKWYLLEIIAWTVKMYLAQRRSDMDEGLATITRELAEVAAQ